MEQMSYIDGHSKMKASSLLCFDLLRFMCDVLCALSFDVLKFFKMRCTYRLDRETVFLLIGTDFRINFREII